MSVQNYLDLVTSEHAKREKFIATLTALLQPLSDNVDLIASLPAKFDISVAVGDQLDAVGKWVGQSRVVNSELTGVYFSFDTDGVGFDEGAWFGPGDSPTGLSTLPDDTYRLLLYARIAINQWDGTEPGAVNGFAAMFEAEGFRIALQDNQDMTMGMVGLTGDVGPLLQALFEQGYMDFRPAGVRINEHVVPSVPGAPFFGFGPETGLIGGFGTGAWASIL